MTVGSLSGRIVIVTGVACGLGAAFTSDLAQEGAKVTVCDVRKPTPVAKSITSAGGSAVAGTGDVTDAEAVGHLVALTVERCGTVQGLVNDAALFADTKKDVMEDLTSADFDLVMTVNIRGAFEMVKAILPQMKRQNGGAMMP